MSYVWDSLIDLQNHFIKTFDSVATEYKEPGMDRYNHDAWINRLWSNDDFRRAHVDVVDAREEKGLWMMHVCVFPHLSSNAPIYGFDVIAGHKLMTGAFHDYSPTTEPNHPMIEYFNEQVEPLQWKRERELPPWAKAIFSEKMMAASAVKEHSEIDQVVSTAKKTLDYFVKNVGQYNQNTLRNFVVHAQNGYAHYQKQNPHTPRVMKTLGLDSDDVDSFIQKCLFPEVK